MSKDNPAPKSTKIEVNKRINQVYDLLLMGFSRAQIIEYGQKEDLTKKPPKHAWNVTEYAIDTYISEANKIYEKVSSVHRQQQFGLAMMRLGLLFQKSMTIQDYKSALAVQREINALLGLYPPKDNKLSINIAIIQQFITVAQAKGYDPTEIVTDFIAELVQLEAIELPDATDSSNQPD